MRSLAAVLLTACTTSLIAQEVPPTVPPDAKTTQISEFRFTDESGSERTVTGRILVESQDGGFLVEDRESAYWNITSQQLAEHNETETEFARLNRDEHLRLLQNRYPSHTDIRKTDHYLIVSNAGPGYTDWCAALLERYQAAFFEFWRDLGLKLDEPEHPLVVIIWRDKPSFDAFYKQDAGRKTGSSFGYYSERKNHVVLYDFANPGSISAEQREKQTVRTIERAIRKVPFNVATVVHEATHQLSYNSGLQTRFADYPLWLTEGLAMYCESADIGLAARKPRIGRSNPSRRKQLKSHLKSITDQSLTTLTETDDRFRSAETALDAYTEAWALTHFLMNRKQSEFVEFLKANQDNPRLIWPTAEQRRERFDSKLGDPGSFERLMQSYLKRLR